MKNIILLGIISCLLLSCNSEKKAPTVATDKKEVSNQKDFNVPALPKEVLQKLYNEATYIDYIFYNLPFSISQDDKPSINSNLNLISQEKLGPIAMGCKPIGREFFHIGGEIVFEAEVYFQGGCYGYVFLDKEKPIYANKISESGMKFYTNIISQAQQIKNNALNGQ